MHHVDAESFDVDDGHDGDYNNYDDNSDVVGDADYKTEGDDTELPNDGLNVTSKMRTIVVVMEILKMATCMMVVTT